VSDSTPPSEAASADYAARIAQELVALHIPADYGAQRHLSLQVEASELTVARVLADGRELQLEPETARAWAALRDSAAAEGIPLLLISGFRSVVHQRDIVRRKLEAGTPLEVILSVNAAPGFSEHHTGRAVDIGTPGCPPLSEAFESTPAFHWLERNAARYGFRLSYPRHNPHGVIYEPWHWFREISAGEMLQKPPSTEKHG
jgi:D-alanyl-D-alanine carboxypeptidase